MAEDTQDPNANPISMGDWENALNEEKATTPVNAAPAAAARSPEPAGGHGLASVFSELGNAGHAGEGGGLELVAEIPIMLSVELGASRVAVKSMMQLGQGSVIELDGRPGDPLNVYANGQLIAKGEVVTVNDHLGIRLTQLVRPKASV
jgi:flagellar motor switch protein FliN/FliY